MRRELADRFKAQRLSQALTQRELAMRSGVSLGSLKCFETTGLVSLDSLLRLALVLGCLPDFDLVCAGSSELEGHLGNVDVGEQSDPCAGCAAHGLV